jgi:hypothetical protein
VFQTVCAWHTVDIGDGLPGSCKNAVPLQGYGLVFMVAGLWSCMHWYAQISDAAGPHTVFCRTFVEQIAQHQCSLHHAMIQSRVTHIAALQHVATGTARWAPGTLVHCQNVTPRAMTAVTGCSSTCKHSGQICTYSCGEAVRLFDYTCTTAAVQYAMGHSMPCANR